MADRGPGPQELIRKRITAEIKRLEAQIEAQELEVMELEERQRRLVENIDASHGEIEKQNGNLAALDNTDKGPEEEMTDG